MNISKYIAVILALAMAACATTGQQITGLKRGMTKEQVIKTIGKPDGYSEQGNMTVMRYTNKLISGWSYDRADYYTVLENGKLSSWGSGEVRQNRPPITPVLVTGNIQTN